ncbi:IS3 family transposase, partial [Glutamicibacter uratoxydans]
MAIAGLARSTYYYQVKALARPDRHAELKTVVKKEFDRNHARYGYRQIRLVLLARGWKVSKKLVLKLMRQLGIASKVRRRKKYSSYQGEAGKIAENLLDRQFEVDTPDTVYASDVSEFPVTGRKLYLSPIMDLCDRSIISFTLSTSPTTAFTTESLARALGDRQFEKKLLVHTDQGFHYRHWSWRNLLAEHGAVQSMSRKGNCYDNAVMENFFGQLKTEMFYGERFESVAELAVAIEDYIAWYNMERRQERLKGMAPMEYR